MYTIAALRSYRSHGVYRIFYPYLSISNFGATAAYFGGARKSL